MTKETMKENIFEGNLIAEAGKVYEYTEITGSLEIRGKASFPRLEKVGGYLSIYANAKLDALTSVGGDLYIYANAKLDAPALTSVGGDLSINANAKLDAPAHMNKNDAGARARCRALLLSSFAAAGYSFADGILARIVSQRGPVQRVIICGQTDISYVVTDGEGNYSHGDTLEEARADLMVKRTSKDLTQFKAWTLDKMVSKADAILAYRSITGACAKGTAHWLKQRQTPDALTVYTIIELTRGAYGAERFEAFFGGVK